LRLALLPCWRPVSTAAVFSRSAAAQGISKIADQLWHRSLVFVASG
jgi:hypothetical protein